MGSAEKIVAGIVTVVIVAAIIAVVVVVGSRKAGKAGCSSGCETCTGSAPADCEACEDGYYNSTEVPGCTACLPAYSSTSDGSGCYLIGMEKLNWTSARDYCVSTGGHLVSIIDQDKNYMVEAWIAEKRASGTIAGAEPFWLGLSDREVEGTWKWTDGKRASFNNWGYNEPDSAYDYDCGLIYMFNDEFGKWITMKCVSKRRFICEI